MWEVRLHGTRRDEQARRDVGVGQALADKAGDVALGGSQAFPSGGRPLALAAAGIADSLVERECLALGPGGGQFVRVDGGGQRIDRLGVPVAMDGVAAVADPSPQTFGRSEETRRLGRTFWGDFERGEELGVPADEARELHRQAVRVGVHRAQGCEGTRKLAASGPIPALQPPGAPAGTATWWGPLSSSAEDRGPVSVPSGQSTCRARRTGASIRSRSRERFAELGLRKVGSGE